MYAFTSEILYNKFPGLHTYYFNSGTVDALTIIFPLRAFMRVDLYPHLYTHLMYGIHI